MANEDAVDSGSKDLEGYEVRGGIRKVKAKGTKGIAYQIT